jgi:hypothetical protein
MEFNIPSSDHVISYSHKLETEEKIPHGHHVIMLQSSKELPKEHLSIFQ